MIGILHTHLGQSALWLGCDRWRVRFWYRFPRFWGHPIPLRQTSDCLGRGRNVRVWRFGFTRKFSANAPVTRGAASAPSPPVAGSDADVRTIIHPALPLESGDYRVTLIHSPRWFLAWGRRQNTGAHRMAPAAGASTVPPLVGPSSSNCHRLKGHTP